VLAVLKMRVSSLLLTLVSNLAALAVADFGGYVDPTFNW